MFFLALTTFKIFSFSLFWPLGSLLIITFKGLAYLLKWFLDRNSLLYSVLEKESFLLIVFNFTWLSRISGSVSHLFDQILNYARMKLKKIWQITMIPIFLLPTFLIFNRFTFLRSSWFQHIINTLFLFSSRSWSLRRKVHIIDSSIKYNCGNLYLIVFIWWILWHLQ